MMTNLNFISSFSLNRMYNLPNVCRHCNCAEENYAHCFLFCKVSTLVYTYFTHLLRQLVDADLTIEEKAFGLPINNLLDKRERLRNYITSCVKCVIFRNRAFIWNGNLNTKSSILIYKCKKFLASDLSSKFINFKSKKCIDKFNEIFLIDNILGTVTSNVFRFSTNI